jgi:diguanylate cyclase (GGDEF)-like protein
MDETVVTTIKSINNNEGREPYLIVIGGQHIGKLYQLDKDELVAGRSADCDIWIEDTAISRKHFRILKSDATCTIEDLNSTNGTYVNTRRVQTAILKAGDKIQISTDTIVEFNYLDENRRVTEQKRYEMGVKDAVTGAYNKSYFLQRIADEFSFSQRQNLPLSIIMIDIDHFKLINDSYGHLAGDQVLQEVCKTVADMIREEDVFCRYGGEEFVIIMRNTACQAAVNLAERIRLKIQDSAIESLDNQQIKVTISAGVSTNVDKKYRDYVGLIAEADKYLYQAKGSGRNRITAICKPEV